MIIFRKIDFRLISFAKRPGLKLFSISKHYYIRCMNRKL